MAQTTTVLISSMILNTTGPGTSVMSVSKNQAVYTQGDPVGAVFYIQEGKVELTVISSFGKKAALAIFSEGEFFGEDGLAHRPLRLGSATAMSDCKVMRIAEKAMAVALQKERELSDLFIMQLLERHIRYQAALVGAAESVTAELNEQSLASMAGTDPP